MVRTSQGADHKGGTRTRDGSSHEAALLRQLPEEIISPPRPIAPQPRQKTAAPKVIGRQRLHKQILEVKYREKS